MSRRLTAGAPSISSIIKQLGLLFDVRTAFISVEDSNIFLNTSGLLSSLQYNINKVIKITTIIKYNIKF